MSQEEDGEIDLYGDLPEFGFEEKLKKKEEENNHLKAKVAELENLIKELNQSKIEIETKCKSLETNISSLYKTAVIEIGRKDRTIQELRAQSLRGPQRRYDNARSKSPQKRDKERSTTARDRYERDEKSRGRKKLSESKHENGRKKWDESRRDDRRRRRSPTPPPKSSKTKQKTPEPPPQEDKKSAAAVLLAEDLLLSQDGASLEAPSCDIPLDKPSEIKPTFATLFSQRMWKKQLTEDDPEKPSSLPPKVNPVEQEVPLKVKSPSGVVTDEHLHVQILQHSKEVVNGLNGSVEDKVDDRVDIICDVEPAFTNGESERTSVNLLKSMFDNSSDTDLAQKANTELNGTLDSKDIVNRKPPCELSDKKECLPVLIEKESEVEMKKKPPRMVRSLKNHEDSHPEKENLEKTVKQNGLTKDFPAVLFPNRTPNRTKTRIDHPFTPISNCYKPPLKVIEKISPEVDKQTLMLTLFGSPGKLSDFDSSDDESCFVKPSPKDELIECSSDSKKNETLKAKHEAPVNSFTSMTNDKWPEHQGQDLFKKGIPSFPDDSPIMKTLKQCSENSGFYASSPKDSIPNAPMCVKYDDTILGQFEDTTQLISALTQFHTQISPICTPIKPDEPTLSPSKETGSPQVLTAEVKSNSPEVSFSPLKNSPIKEQPQSSPSKGSPSKNSPLKNSFHSKVTLGFDPDKLTYTPKLKPKIICIPPLEQAPGSKKKLDKPVNILKPRKTPRVVTRAPIKKKNEENTDSSVNNSIEESPKPIIETIRANTVTVGATSSIKEGNEAVESKVSLSVSQVVVESVPETKQSSLSSQEIVETLEAEEQSLVKQIPLAAQEKKVASKQILTQQTSDVQVKLVTPEREDKKTAQTQQKTVKPNEKITKPPEKLLTKVKDVLKSQEKVSLKAQEKSKTVKEITRTKQEKVLRDESTRLHKGTPRHRETKEKGSSKKEIKKDLSPKATDLNITSFLHEILEKQKVAKETPKEGFLRPVAPKLPVIKNPKDIQSRKERASSVLRRTKNPHTQSSSDRMIYRRYYGSRDYRGRRSPSRDSKSTRRRYRHSPERRKRRRSRSRSKDRSRHRSNSSKRSHTSKSHSDLLSPNNSFSRDAHVPHKKLKSETPSQSAPGWKLQKIDIKGSLKARYKKLSDAIPNLDSPLSPDRDDKPNRPKVTDGLIKDPHLNPSLFKLLTGSSPTRKKLKETEPLEKTISKSSIDPKPEQATPRVSVEPKEPDQQPAPVRISQFNNGTYDPRLFPKSRPQDSRRDSRLSSSPKAPVQSQRPAQPQTVPRASKTPDSPTLEKSVKQQGVVTTPTALVAKRRRAANFGNSEVTDSPKTKISSNIHGCFSVITSS